MTIFVPGETLRAGKLNLLDFRAADLTALNAAIPNPSNGQPAYLLDTKKYVRWDAGANDWLNIGEPPVPDPINVHSPNGSVGVTATSFADIATSPAGGIKTDLVLARPCWVEVRVGTTAIFATGAGITLGFEVSGATTRAVGAIPAEQQWYPPDGSQANIPIVPKFKLNAGTNTIALKAKRQSATGTQTLYLPTMHIVPIAWA